MAADNPYAERPAGSGTKRKSECPPDMPRGDSDADKAARQRYWIDVGNEKLWAAGKHHLHWRAKDGHYWIEERDETARQIEADRRIRDATRVLGRTA